MRQVAIKTAVREAVVAWEIKVMRAMLSKITRSDVMALLLVLFGGLHSAKKNMSL